MDQTAPAEFSIILRVVQIAPENFAIRLALQDPLGHVDPDSPVLTELQSGYRTPHQALAALVECLSFAPPDLTSYDEAIGRVSQVIDAQGNAEDAIAVLDERLQNCEDAIAGMRAPAGGQPKGNPLLGRRRISPTVLDRAPAQPPPPPIRRSIGMISHAGGITGGPTGGRYAGVDPNAATDDGVDE